MSDYKTTLKLLGDSVAPATTEVPTELLMSLMKLLDVIPPILEDWIRTTGFGEVNARDRAVLADVLHAKKLHRQWLFNFGVSL